MKSFKENILIKTVFAYIDLFYKLFFPFFILFYLLPLALQFPSFPNSNWNNTDIMGLFEKQREDVKFNEVPQIYKSIVFALNILVVGAMYCSLKKLNGFMKNVFDGNPFSKENGKILKLVGAVLTITAAVVHLTTGLMIDIKTNHLRSEIKIFLMKILNVIFVIFDPFVVIGLFVIVLGEIFIHGAVIKEEIDLTV